MKLNLKFVGNKFLLYILLFFFLYLLFFHIVKMIYMNSNKNIKTIKNSNILLDHTIYYNETLDNEEYESNNDNNNDNITSIDE